MFELLKTEQTARRGVFCTVHGDFQTPCFMNVATANSRGSRLMSELCRRSASLTASFE